MNGINLKGFAVRSFMVRGLTAKWGIGENRVPPIWDNNLVGYWDARDLPNGKANAIANKATIASKLGDIVGFSGAQVVNGTVIYNGIDNRTTTGEFVMPEKFTVFWDVDWLGDVDVNSGITVRNTFSVFNKASTQQLSLSLGGTSKLFPNTVIGMQTDGKVYNRDGSIVFEGLQAGATRVGKLLIGHTGGNTCTKMGFRQLLIFNKELSPAEVNDVLRVMFTV